MTSEEFVELYKGCEVEVKPCVYAELHSLVGKCGVIERVDDYDCGLIIVRFGDIRTKQFRQEELEVIGRRETKPLPLPG